MPRAHTKGAGAADPIVRRLIGTRPGEVNAKPGMGDHAGDLTKG